MTIMGQARQARGQATAMKSSFLAHSPSAAHWLHKACACQSGGGWLKDWESLLLRDGRGALRCAAGLAEAHEHGLGWARGRVSGG